MSEHSIDIKVIEIEAYKDPKNNEVLIEPHVILPLPISKFSDIDRVFPGSGPSRMWKTDSKKWHIEKRCSSATRSVFVALNQLLQDSFDVEPSWDQKYYVAYRIGNDNWLVVHTRPNTLRVDTLVPKGTFDQTQLAKRLGVEEFGQEESLSDKLNLPSSVTVKWRNEKTDRNILRMKKKFNLENPTFLEFLQESYDAFSR